MNTFGFNTIFTVLNLLLVSDCYQEPCLPERSLQCGLRPAGQSASYDNGAVAYAGQWPWHGTVYHYRKRARVVEFACSGTLISERHVLIASICAIGGNGSWLESGELLFRIGTHAQNVFNFGRAQHRKVGKIHQSGDFNAKRNKLAILELSEMLRFNEYVQPACVRKDRNHFIEKLGVVTGWGLEKGKDFIGNYKSRRFDCQDFDSLQLNRTFICSQDPGASVIYKWGHNFTTVGMIDCTKKAVDLCARHTPFEEDTIQVSKYFSWIVDVADLDHLQKIRKGQNYDPSKQYSDILPRRNCGNLVLSGNTTHLYQYPWMAIVIGDMLDFYDNKATCMGTLISHHYVLTTSSAEFCIGEPKFVRLGDYDTQTNPDCSENEETECASPYEDYEVAYTILHQDYFNKPMDYAINDIALIRTKKAVYFDDHIQPVCLPITQNLRQLSIKRYTKTGWKPRSKSPNLLQKNVVTLSNITDCLDNHAITNVDAIMCTKGKQHFRFGSPLSSIVEHNGRRFVQFTVVSYELKGSTLYTLTSCNMDWIVANMKK